MRTYLKQINNKIILELCLFLVLKEERGERMCSAKGRRERNSIEKLLDWVFDTKGNIGERGYGICESWGFYNWFLNKY